MKYRSGYKYQLAADESFQTAFRPTIGIVTPFMKMTCDGLLTTKRGYAWDGPSGPTIDTPLFIYASLPHDALYQLMREQKLSPSDWRLADFELENVVRTEIEKYNWAHRKLWEARIVWVMKGLKIAGGAAAKPRNRKKVKVAP